MLTKQGGEVVLDFASATWFGIMGVYVMGWMLEYFGKSSARDRPTTFGWTMFDYTFQTYLTDNHGWVDVVELIVQSNFGYPDFAEPFVAYGKDEL